MKKIILITGLLAGFLGSSVFSNPGFTNPQQETEQWTASTDNTWMGRDKTMYKMEPKYQIMMSKDGKTWEPAKDGKWQDSKGNWLQYKDDRLTWSRDNGKTWTDVPEWKWEGPEGRWYALNKQGKIMTMKKKTETKETKKDKKEPKGHTSH